MFVCSLIINMSDLLDSEEAKPSFIQRSLQLTKFAALSLKQSTYAFLLATSFYLLGTHAHHILWVGVVPLMGALYCLAKGWLSSKRPEPFSINIPKPEDQTLPQEAMPNLKKLQPSSHLIKSILKLNKKLPYWITVSMNLLAYFFLSTFIAQCGFILLTGIVFNALNILNQMQEQREASEDKDKTIDYVEFAKKVCTNPFTLTCTGILSASNHANKVLVGAITSNCLHAIYFRLIHKDKVEINGDMPKKSATLSPAA